MKYVVLMLLAAISLQAYSQAKDEFIITGKVPGMNTGMVYLTEFLTSHKTDSVFLENGTFRFTGKVSEPTPYILSFMRNFVNRPLLNFFVEPGTVFIDVNKDDITKSKVKGPRSANEYMEYASRIKPFNDQISSLSNRRREAEKGKDAPVLDSIAKAREVVDQKREDATVVFIKSHPASAVSAWAITRSLIYGDDVVLLESLYNGLVPALHTTSYGKRIKERLDNEKKFAIGQPAIDFTQADTLGKMVSLKDFRGRYVLLDFWASWCGPCRMENPNVVAAFNKFKDKNFTVLGVSLDREGAKEAWLNAIHKDGLTWTHVSDLKFWDNDVAKMYGINSVPSNLLIDPSGKIVAKNIRGPKLEEKLKEIL